tara:strand:- start:8026 stop:8595 length:570 start_codon:yes stop_codon:yes gene_type:complete
MARETSGPLMLTPAGPNQGQGPLFHTPIKKVLVKEPIPQMRGTFPIDMQLIVDIWNIHHYWTVEGTRIGQLSTETAPEREFARLMKEAAALYVKGMKGQKYELLTNQSEMRVWGPKVPRDWEAARSGTISRGRQGTELPMDGHADFVITGDFLAHTQWIDQPERIPQEKLSRIPKPPPMPANWKTMHEF